METEQIEPAKAESGDWVRNRTGQLQALAGYRLHLRVFDTPVLLKGSQYDKIWHRYPPRLAKRACVYENMQWSSCIHIYSTIHSCIRLANRSIRR